MMTAHTRTQAGRTRRLDTGTLKGLSGKVLLPWLIDAAGDWLIIAGAFAAVGLWPGPLTMICALLLIGNRQHALAILGHDGTHYTLSRNHRLNDLLTNLLCFWPLGLTVSGYRALHYAHHKHTGTADDPELAHKRMRAPQWDLPASRWTVLQYAALDLTGASVKDFVIIVTFSKPARRSHYAPLIAWHVAGTAIALAAGLWWVPALWYAGLMTSFMMFFRLRLWLEHQGTDTTQRVSLTPWQAWLLAPHNGWYHWEHHKYPAVSYRNLPAVRAAVCGDSVRLGALIEAMEFSRPIASGTPLKDETGKAKAPALAPASHLDKAA